MDWRLAKSVALLFTVLTLGAFGLLNFSFGYFAALLLVPAAVFARPSPNRLISFLRIIAIVIIGSPMTLALVLCLLHPVIPLSEPVHQQIGSLFSKAIADQHIHGTRFWTALCLGYIPAWLFLYFIPFLKPLDITPSKPETNGKTDVPEENKAE